GRAARSRRRAARQAARTNAHRPRSRDAGRISLAVASPAFDQLTCHAVARLARHLHATVLSDESDRALVGHQVRAARGARREVEGHTGVHEQVDRGVDVVAESRDHLAAGEPDHRPRAAISASKKLLSGGSVANSAWKASRSTARTLLADTARTVAVRGRSLTSAISPKHSPRPSRRSGVSPPARSRTISTSPSVTMYSQSPCSPSRKITCPGSKYSRRTPGARRVSSCTMSGGNTRSSAQSVATR